MKKSLIISLGAALLALLMSSCCPCRKQTNKNHKPMLSTEWRLVQLDGRNLTQEFDAQEQPRLIFAEDGSFGGYGGCNSLGGQYQLTPSEALSQRDTAGKITLGGLYSTKRYCPKDQVEMSLLKALSEVDAYTIEQNRLFLFANGELKIVLQAGEGN